MGPLAAPAWDLWPLWDIVLLTAESSKARSMAEYDRCEKIIPLGIFPLPLLFAFYPLVGLPSLSQYGGAAA
ncbi:hypothetical protein BDW66DRAFT_131481 [Aspergillus desertorum]